MTDTKPTLGLRRPSFATLAGNLRPGRLAAFSPRRVVAGLLSVALLVAAGGLARAADDEERKDEWLDQKLFRNFMGGLGLTNDSDNINYHERSPLVIPPAVNLPPPENAAAVRQNPAWPKDPDRTKAKQDKKREAITQGYWDDEAKPLRPDQLDKPRNGPIRTTADGPTVEESGRPVKPSELGYKGGIFSSLFGYKEEVVPFTGEPVRETLIEPPKGYRTPSPAQPYGILGKEAVKPLNQKDKGTGTGTN
jgi:hypothetical protein